MSPHGCFLMAQPQILLFCLRQHGSDATTAIYLALATMIHSKVYNLQPSRQHLAANQDAVPKGSATQLHG